MSPGAWIIVGVLSLVAIGGTIVLGALFVFTISPKSRRR